jgi:calcineurin-like phosphoesterase family protein
MIYFTADWHLNHKNILKYCDRPFKNVHHMNRIILDNYDNTVKEDDHVYFLGDLTMESSSSKSKFVNLFQDLPGHKKLVLGNHDKFKPFDYHDMGFESVHTLLNTSFNHIDLSLGTSEFFMVHDPAYAYLPNTVWLCAHIHNHWKSQRTDNNIILINVGVDVWDFKPVSFGRVVEEICKYVD